MAQLADLLLTQGLQLRSAIAYPRGKGGVGGGEIEGKEGPRVLTSTSCSAAGACSSSSSSNVPLSSGAVVGADAVAESDRGARGGRGVGTHAHTHTLSLSHTHIHTRHGVAGEWAEAMVREAETLLVRVLRIDPLNAQALHSYCLLLAGA
jgi:hypothetical protein